MESLVSTAVNGLTRLAAEIKKFQYKTSFSESWDKNLEGVQPLVFLEKFLGIKDGDSENLKFDQIIEGIKSENDDVRLKKRLIDALNCCGNFLRQLSRESNEKHNSTLTEIWKHTLGFQTSFKQYTNQHKRCLLVSSRGNPDSSISRLMASTLTQKGLHQAGDFQEISEDLHRRVRDMFNKVEEDASQQYNQTIRELISKIDLWKKVENFSLVCEDYVTNITPVDPKESIKIHVCKKKILALLEEIRNVFNAASLLLIQESPKVIRGSFELVEHVLEELFTVLRKTKDRCEEVGLIAAEQGSNLGAREFPEIYLRFPKETIELLQQSGKAKPESRRKFNPPNSLESGEFKKQVTEATESWYQYVADYVPFLAGPLNREASEYSEAVLNMFPCAGNSSSLQTKVREHKVRITEGIKVSGTIYQIPDALIFEGKKLGSDKTSILLFPRVAVIGIDPVGDDTGKECLMHLKTVKGKLPVYLLGSDREAIISWFKQSAKDQEDRYPILRIKPIENGLNGKNEDKLCWKESVWLPVPSTSFVARSVKIPSKYIPRLKSRANRVFRSAYWLSEMGGRMLESKALFPGMQLTTFLPFLIGNPKLKNHLGALFEATFMKYKKGQDQIVISPLNPTTNFAHDSDKPIQILVENFLLLPPSSSTVRLYQAQGGEQSKVCGIVVTVMDCMLDTVLIAVNSETGGESQLWGVRQLQHGVEVLRSTTALPNKANQEGDFDTCWKNLIHKKLEEITQEQIVGRKDLGSLEGASNVYREACSQLNTTKSVTKGSANSTTMMQEDEIHSMQRNDGEFFEQEDVWTEDLSALSSEGGEEENSNVLEEVAKK
jgi:hypothetical protein